MQMPTTFKTKAGTFLEVSLIVLSFIALTILHYYWADAPRSYHLVLQFLYYLPVIYSTLRYSFAGGVLAALAATMVYALHMLGPMSMTDFINHLLQIVLINLIGWVTGALAYKEKDKAKRLEHLAEVQRSLINKLESSNQQVALMYDNLTREIAERQALEERMRCSERLTAMGHLAAGVAHEIRNPLGIIRATMQVMDNEQRDNDGLKEFSDIIKEECDRMNLVIEEFLLFARPEEPKRQAIHLSDLLESILLFTNKYISNQHILLHKDFEADTEPISADPSQLKQVFINLIINAVEAMPAGGDLFVSVKKDSNQQEISIRDTGSGISPAVLPQIFDPFYSTKPTGTGLGLSIAYRIVEGHGGEIKTISNPAEGTEFIVTLPRGV